MPLRWRIRLREWGVLVTIAAGGTAGALGRYGVSVAIPPTPGGFPLGTFLSNVAGCALIGVLMVLVTEARTPHRLIRPFLGIGVLGGFTMFSTYAVETQKLIENGAAGQAFLYMFGTLFAALVAVQGGTALTRLLIRSTREGRGAS